MEIVSRDRRAGVHPADRRRGSRLGRGRRPAAARRRRQGRRQHRRDPPPRAGRRDRRPVRQPGARALGRRPPRATGHRLAASRSPPTAAEAAGLDAVAWAARAAELGAGEILLNAMDADGTQDGFDLELIRAGPRRGLDPGDRLRRRRPRRALRARRSTPAPTPSSPRPSSTSARCASATSRRRSPRPVTRSADGAPSEDSWVWAARCGWSRSWSPSLAIALTGCGDDDEPATRPAESGPPAPCDVIDESDVEAAFGEPVPAGASVSAATPWTTWRGRARTATGSRTVSWRSSSRWRAADDFQDGEVRAVAELRKLGTPSSRSPTDEEAYWAGRGRTDLEVPAADLHRRPAGRLEAEVPIGSRGRTREQTSPRPGRARQPRLTGPRSRPRRAAGRRGRRARRTRGRAPRTARTGTAPARRPGR